jgi:hypothetical protein
MELASVESKTRQGVARGVSGLFFVAAVVAGDFRFCFSPCPPCSPWLKKLSIVSAVPVVAKDFRFYLSPCPS